MLSRESVYGAAVTETLARSLSPKLLLQLIPVTATWALGAALCYALEQLLETSFPSEFKSGACFLLWASLVGRFMYAALRSEEPATFFSRHVRRGEGMSFALVWSWGLLVWGTSIYALALEGYQHLHGLSDNPQATLWWVGQCLGTGMMLGFLAYVALFLMGANILWAAKLLRVRQVLTIESWVNAWEQRRTLFRLALYTLGGCYCGILGWMAPMGVLLWSVHATWLAPYHLSFWALWAAFALGVSPIVVGRLLGNLLRVVCVVPSQQASRPAVALAPASEVSSSPGPSPAVPPLPASPAPSSPSLSTNTRAWLERSRQLLKKGDAHEKPEILLHTLELCLQEQRPDQAALLYHEARTVRHVLSLRPETLRRIQGALRDLQYYQDAAWCVYLEATLTDRLGEPAVWQELRHVAQKALESGHQQMAQQVLAFIQSKQKVLI